LRRFILFFLIILSVSRGFAQNLSNIRTGEILITGDSIVIDTLSIVPGSFFLFDPQQNLIPDSLYTVDFSAAVLRIDKSLQGMQIKLTYRTFPLNFSKPYARKDTGMINPYLKPGVDPFRITGSELRTEGDLQYEEVSKRGSISRGITLGNNQDLVVNSDLNLQLNGKISEDLRIVAAISDNNIPIQPDGTAQNIHEFDRVYIKIFNESLSLLAGDFDNAGSPGHFLKFYKKGKGVLFSGKFNLNEAQTASLKTTVSGSISKGLVCRNSFNGKEGVQGPYKLRGTNNEQFIIVLAGSERIYVDGRLLSRGLENDYIIDYNNAEITFTPNQLITKDRRIIVEFEYSEKSYARFLVYNSNEFITRKSNFWINVYSEQDNKNQTLQQDLSQEDKEILAATGDDLNKAVVPRIDSVGFNASEVLYKKVDTTILGMIYNDIFVYSTHPDSACYRLGFSFVGEGHGNYISIKSSANGKVYRWTEPVNGTPSGDYEPVILLVTPKKKQVITLGGKTFLTPYTSASLEASLTNNNLNTFSELDRDDNLGYAFKGGISQDFLKKDTSETMLRLTGNYQFINSHFKAVERFRPVEFERDWNLPGDDPESNEHMADVRIDYSRKDMIYAGFRTEYLNRGDIYKGLRNTFQGSARLYGFHLNFNGNLMNSSDSIYSTSFLRNQLLISKQIRYVVIGIREESEQNLWNSNLTDTLQANSFRYNQYEMFLASPDTSENGFLINYRIRKDYLPLQNQIRLANTGRDFNFGFRLGKNPNNRLKTSLIYRSLEINDTSLSDVDGEQSLIGRLDHSLSVLKGGIISSTFYETGSGLESQKEYTYLEVTPGQGVYTWTDYNGNGVLELDEFEIAVFQDQAKYIRVYTPTEAFINVYTTQFNQSFQIHPLRFWRNQKGFRKLISLFSDQFAYRIDKKNSDGDPACNMNPFTTQMDSPGLISLSTSIRNNLSLNKSGQKFGMDYIFQKNMNRTLLANGFDTRTLSSHGTRIRFSPESSLTFINQTDAGNKTFESEYFMSRNFDIGFITSDLSVQFQPGIMFRMILDYKISDEKNRMDSEHSTKHDISFETTYNILNKGTMTGRLNFIHINYNENPYTPVAYEMLQGLQPGNNGIWSLSLVRALTGGLELNMEYTGRVSENQSVIHYGGIQVRWSF
jgi:hypothetical protein